jgi:hypothetical protein
MAGSTQRHTSAYFNDLTSTTPTSATGLRHIIRPFTAFLITDDPPMTSLTPGALLQVLSSGRE